MIDRGQAQKFLPIKNVHLDIRGPLEIFSSVFVISEAAFDYFQK